MKRRVQIRDLGISQRKSGARMRAYGQHVCCP